MSRTNLKKFPIARYLAFLLITAVLFTGATFSRYSSFTSGDLETIISKFAVSYEIGDMSAATFANADYWLTISDDKVAMNAARSVRFTVRNYTLRQDETVDRVSEVDLQGSLRFYAPAEFISSLAVQVVEVDDSGGYVTQTPQYVISEFLYDENGNFRSWNQGDTVDTKNFEDYDAREDGAAVDEVLYMNGGFSRDANAHTGMISAYCPGTDNRLSITASMTETEYSVGFYRRSAGEDSLSAPQFYLDCVKEIPFYALDITLPEMFFSADEGARQASFVVFITVLDRNEGEDFDVQWDQKYLQEGAVFNGARVTGYHFDRDAEIYAADASGALVPTGAKTTIRIKKSFTDNGGVISYWHVAPLSEGAPSLVHPVTDFYDGTGGAAEVGDFSKVTTVHGLYGKCSNGGASGFISLAGVTDDPYHAEFTADESAADDYAIDKSLSKGYATKLNVLFAQMSQTEG